MKVNGSRSNGADAAFLPPVSGYAARLTTPTVVNHAA
jgi:hypothetical protein